MMKQYQLKLKAETAEKIPAFWAYRLYAWLLSQIPEETAEYFHSEEIHSVSQYLSGGNWVVNLFGDEAIALFSPVLEKAEKIELQAERLCVLSCEAKEETGSDLLQKGRRNSGRRVEIDFISPTSFKQNGRYVIFPQERLILQSILSRWNEVCPEYLLKDEDMLEAMLHGIHITDYNLRTGRYHLKSTAIPCFYGKIYLESRLPVVLQELWHSVLRFAEFSGIGIKTTLGMGGVHVILPDADKTISV